MLGGEDELDGDWLDDVVSGKRKRDAGGGRDASVPRGRSVPSAPPPLASLPPSPPPAPPASSRPVFRPDGLRVLADDPDSAAPGVVVAVSPQYVVIRDLYPKAKLHLLALFRPGALPSAPGAGPPQTPSELRRLHVPALRGLYAFAKMTMQGVLQSGGGPAGVTVGTLRFGFHALPSLTPPCSPTSPPHTLAQAPRHPGCWT